MKRQFHLLAVILVLAAAPFTGVLGNNLSVSNVTYSQGAQTVTFDLKWDNGWRNTGVAPHNWDAAWVFVKWRSCDSTANAPFVHGLINTNVASHTFNGTDGGGTTTYEPTTKTGTVGIDAASDNTGVMLRNAADPVTGTFNARVTLNVTNFPTSGSFDVRVFGIEMVYCLPGAYYLGDGDYLSLIEQSGSNNISSGAFSNASSQYKPYFVSSDNAQSIGESSSIWCGGSCSVTASFQKGFGAFYIMKYEISQGQYADFLSTVNQFAQEQHYQPLPNLFSWLNQTNHFFQYRFTIQAGGPIPTQYIASRPDRACNWMSWSDFAAYLDWAAMRPLSEMEYEKACRGPLTPIPFEKAWGQPYNSYTGTAPNLTPTLTAPGAGGLSVSPENGTEVSTTNTTAVTIGGANCNIATTVNSAGVQWTSGDAGSGAAVQGPLRCGIFVKSTNTSRMQSGIGYYGAADLTGNVGEYYLSAYSGVSGNVAQNGISEGDGNLNATGNCDVTTWPYHKSPTGPSFAYVIMRGGDWYRGDPASPVTNSSNYANVSFRSTTYQRQGTNTGRTRDQYTGGRGGR